MNDLPDTPPPRSPWQFGLRAVLILTTLVATYMAFWYYQVEKIRSERIALEKIIEVQLKATSQPNFWIAKERVVETSPVPWWLLFSGEKEVSTVLELSFDVVSYDDALPEASPVDDELLLLIAKFYRMRKLDLSRAKISDAGLAVLAPLQELEELNLSSTPITDAGLADIGKLRALRDLNVSSTEIRGEGLAKLEECPLQVLNLNETIFESRYLDQISRLKSLERLHLHSPHLDQLQLIDHPRLKEVRAGMDGPSLVIEVKGLPELTDLQVFCQRGTGLESIRLADLPRLEVLHVFASDSCLTGAPADFVLHNAPQLRETQLDHDDLIILFVPQLARCLRLSEVLFYNHLGNLSDESIEPFAAHQEIQQIRIPYINLSDRSLMTLATIPMLEEISIGARHATAAGVESLAAASHLKQVTISQLQLEAPTANAFARFPALRNLYLGEAIGEFVMNRGDAGDRTNGFGKLELLTISGDRVTSIGVSGLPALKDVVVACRHAREIRVHSLKKLERLDVSFGANQIVDRFRVADLPELQWLSLQGGAHLPGNAFDGAPAFTKLSGGILDGLTLPAESRAHVQAKLVPLQKKASMDLEFKSP